MIRPYSDSIEGSSGVEAEAAIAIEAAFERSEPAGLLHLATVASALPPSLAFGRELATHFVQVVCSLPEHQADDEAVRRLAPAEGWARGAVEAAPPVHGGEYLDEELLIRVFARLAHHVAARMKDESIDLASFLESIGGTWHALGRVWFHLAENRDDERRPFAFLATYTPIRPQSNRVQHTPLANALEELSGQRDALLRLLAPVQRAAERSELIERLLDDGEIFHPLAWTADEAYEFLGEAEKLDGTGVMLRLPKSWQGKRPSSPRVDVQIGEAAELGANALLEFDVRLALDGEPLSSAERRKLLRGTSRLAWLRGRWVEVDPAQLEETLARWAERAEGGGIGFAEGLRMLAEDEPWTDVRAGAWFEEILARLNDPQRAPSDDVSPRLRATLRPYQREGVAWLSLLYDLGLGGCLADDMGLGKTIQVVGLLLRIADETPDAQSLVVVPASLVGNWRAELERFAPELRVVIAHRSLTLDIDAALEEHADVVLTTYGTLSRVPALLERTYAVAVLDEAQAIKNPGTRQAKTAKTIEARCRLALTGTPIENRLGDLWSLFDFVSPGLLGSPTAFKRFLTELRNGGGYAPLRRFVRPYILRRLKTDKRIISDLPDKAEVDVFCSLTKKQAALYGESVTTLTEAIQDRDGIDRRGLILSYLTRFKQICNHPSQWLGDGAWQANDSGKLLRLKQIAKDIAERQEKVLVFTQYREVTGPLSDHLAEVFGRPGLVLHGGTPVKQRAKMVKAFEADDGPPFFVLSLKAGGTGLNLTAASHVVHFDRWWNPAVENQATDRAYRIGQHRNVLVHRFVCQGTLEERIDAMLTSKRALSEEVLAGDGGQQLTEMSNDELLSVIRLDLSTALENGDS